jgi:putative heme-binding domain-containing protein
MRSCFCLVLALLLVTLPGLSRQPNPHIVATDPLSPEKEKAQFRLPPGFEAQLVAAEPDIQKPMNLAFDDQGRLWVTDTIEYPFPAKPGSKPRDTLKILEDFGPDGKARKITTFADGLNIPIGVLSLPGARDGLVFSIPQIYRVKDRTGTGTADKREPLYGSFEVRDTHGMTNAFLHGFDGWVYACHGYANRSTIKGSDGQAITMHSGNTYRMKTDGSHLEQFTWGQVNPFGLAIDPHGYLYTADCHSEPIYQLIRGGYYPSFGKPHDGLGFAPQMFARYKGSTAISGIAYYAADAYPAAHRGTAFVGDVVTNQIVQFRITWQGASPQATDQVFLDSKDRWFRPVDVKLGPDGNIYIADFYNRIIGHYEVDLHHPGRDRHRGRIWRIVYKGADASGTVAPAKGNLATASLDTLAEGLAHPNLTVRLQVTNQLVHRGGKDVIALARKALDSDLAPPQAHGLWILERLGALDVDTLRRAVRVRSDLVRVHASRILAERPRWSTRERELALNGLKDISPHVQRACADALGLHADAVNVRPLLEVIERVPAGDSHLLHTVRIALRNQLRPDQTWKHVASETWSEKHARTLADVALGVPSPESARYLLPHIKANRYPLAQMATFIQHIARFGEDTRALVAFCQGHQADSLADQAILVRAIQRGRQERGQPLTPEMLGWGGDLADKLLDSKHTDEMKLGIDLVGQLRLAKRDERLLRLSGAGARLEIRLPALSALANLDASKHAVTLGKALTDASLPVEAREQLVGLLAASNQPATREQLLTGLLGASARLQNSIAAGLASSREGGEALLAAIASGKASARLVQEQAVLVRLRALGLPMLKERLGKLTAGLPPADVKQMQLVAARRKGFLSAKVEVSKGAAVFEKHCGNCHQVAGKGAKVGPQLDGIGLRGLDRLLEDTLDPNRNVDQAFRTTSLTLLSGKLVQGLLLREEGEVVILADNQGKEVRVAKKDIEKRDLSPLSPMPANLVEQISESDFYHLLAYLLSQKPTKS